MDTFLMICYVAADFSNRMGDTFRVTPAQIGTFVEAPTWVKDTLLFSWLVKDGTVKVAEKTISKKQGENDPMEGVAADGKDEAVSEAVEEEIKDAVKEPEKLVKPRTKKTKKAVDAK